MPQNATFEVTVDINTKAGKIDTAKLLTGVEAQIKRELSKTKTTEIPPNFTFNKSKVNKQIATLSKRIQESLAKELNVAGLRLGIAESLQAELSKADSSIVKGGKVVQARLNAFLRMLRQASTDSKGFRAASAGIADIFKGLDSRSAVVAVKNIASETRKQLKDTTRVRASELAKAKSFAKSLEQTLRNTSTIAVQVEKQRTNNLKQQIRERLSLFKKEKEARELKTRQGVRSGGFSRLAGAERDVQTSKIKEETVATNLLTRSKNALADADRRLKEANAGVQNSRKFSANVQLRALRDQESAINQNIRLVNRLRTAQQAAGQSTKEYDARLKNLNRQLGKTERALRGPLKTFQEFANSLRTFVRFAVAFKVLGGITRGFRFLADSVVSLEDSLKSIQAVARATSKEMLAVENAIKNVATTTQFTTTEIAQAAQTLAQAGVGPGSISETLSAVANFAAATNASLAVAADLISTMRNVFKELNATQISDQLTNAINISKLTAGDLQTILSRLAQTSKSFNIVSKQMLAAVTVLKNAGIRSSTISTGLRQGLLEILSPDEKTLAVLEKRYQAIGENLSKQAIKAIFNNFSNTANPILAAINELEKLGIAGSGAADFERVFDVRAENVIKALIANKQQFIENTQAIGRTGSAAKGARTQLESLTKSASNLAAIVSTLASDLSGPLLDGLKDIVNGASEAARSLRELLATQKSLTGSSGVGASLELGIGVAGVSALKGLGAVRSAIAGTVATLIAGAVNTQAGESQGVTKGITKALSTVAEVILGLALVKGLLPNKGALDGLVKLKDAVVKSAGSLKTLGVFLRRFLGRTNLIIAGIAAVFGLIRIFSQESFQDALERLDTQKDILAKNLEEAKQTVADLEVKVANSETNKNDLDGIGRSIEAINSSVASYSQSLIDFLNQAAKATKDAGTDVFKNTLAEFNALLVAAGQQELGANEFVNLLQQREDITVKVEGRRVEFQKELLAAYDSISEPDSAEFVRVFEALSQEQRALFNARITDSKQALQFATLLKELSIKGAKEFAVLSDQLINARGEVSAREVDLFRKQLETADRAKRGIVAREKALKSSQTLNLGGEPDKELEGNLAQFQTRLAAVRATLAEKAQEGFVSAIETLGGLAVAKAIIPAEELNRFIQTAAQNAKAKLQQSLQGQINELSAVPTKTTETLTLQESLTITSQRDVSARELTSKNAEDLQKLTREQIDNAKLLRENLIKQVELSKSGVTDSELLNTLVTEQASLQKEKVDIDTKLANISKSTVTSVDKVAQLQASFVVDNQKLKELDRRLAAAKRAEVQDVEKIASIAKERAALEVENLQQVKQATEGQLRTELLNVAGVSTLGLSLNEIIAAYGTTAGQLQLQEEKYKKVGQFLGILGETTADLASAEERLTETLTNARSKVLNAEKSRLTSVLNSQKRDSEVAQRRLDQATKDLASARKTLAEKANKTLADQAFFDKLLNGGGAPTGRAGGRRAQELVNKARRAGTDEGAVRLAKEAATLAASLKQSGDLTRRQADRIIDSAKTVTTSANRRQEDSARLEVQLQQKRQVQEANNLQEAKAASAKTVVALDQLNTTLTALPAQIAAAVSKAIPVAAPPPGPSSTEPNIFEQVPGLKDAVQEAKRRAGGEGPVQLADGGLISGPGGPTEDKAGIFALSNKEFVQPAKATKFYGEAFMEKVRNLELPKEGVAQAGRGVPTTPNISERAITRTTQPSLRPVTLNIGSASFEGQASDDSIDSFNRSLTLQALKVGTRN